MTVSKQLRFMSVILVIQTMVL